MPYHIFAQVPPLCYLHYVSYFRYVLEAFYVAEANMWSNEIELMCVGLDWTAGSGVRGGGGGGGPDAGGVAGAAQAAMILLMPLLMLLLLAH
jgi:hypothetical protein